MIDAHAICCAIMAISCGDSGGINILLALAYVLTLNVLVIALVHIVLFNLAYAQTRLAYVING